MCLLHMVRPLATEPSSSQISQARGRDSHLTPVVYGNGSTGGTTQVNSEVYVCSTHCHMHVAISKGIL